MERTRFQLYYGRGEDNEVITKLPNPEETYLKLDNLWIPAGHAQICPAPFTQYWALHLHPQMLSLAIETKCLLPQSNGELKSGEIEFQSSKRESLIQAVSELELPIYESKIIQRTFS